MKNLIFLAVQGAGKGTVAQALVQKYNYVHISTGDLLRERRKINDEIGKIIAETQDTGVLTPSEVVYKVFEETLSAGDKSYILDGFPRNLEQAKKCDEILKRAGKDDYIVINLTVPDDILIDRITSRRTCSECGKIYNINFAEMMPKTSGKCDVCDGNLVQRNDDSDADAIQKRINIYHENSGELIDFYHQKGNLYNIDSTETKHAITAIEKLINHD